MISVGEFLKRAADRNGFNRDRFEDRQVPTDFTNVCVLPFFGDLRGSAILSSFILPRYREEVKGSKYFIIASWPGMQGMFPYCDEYWSFADQSALKRIYEAGDCFKNRAETVTTFIRNMNEFFRDVVDVADLSKFYNSGFTNYFFERFRDTKRFLPFLPSSAILGKDINRDLMSKPGYKVFIHPSVFCKFWQGGMTHSVRSKREFWTELCNFLSSNGYTPVVWQNFSSWDLSEGLTGSHILFRENDYVRAMSMMRSCGCVLDVFNNISRLSLMARTPFLCVEERNRHFYTKESEIDDLMSLGVPHEYIFTFGTILTEGNPAFWSKDIFRNIAVRLEQLLPNINRDGLPSTSESYEAVPYGKTVQSRKRKKLGTRFIKVIYD